MTFGYRTDAIVIRSLAGKSFKYLGVLGSRNKIRQLFEEFINEGIPTDFLDEVHAPIGLHIHSQTPEEIAVSIAAEIVGVKNGSSSIEQQ
jgi:xanthine dehydrogenase accessory factor